MPIEHIIATKNQTQRREKSEAYCKLHGVPIYNTPTALFINDDDSVAIRSQQEVINRAVALCYIGLKSEGLEKSYLEKFDKDFNVSPQFTDKERTYVYASKLTDQQKIDANWKYEDLHVMLWALGFIDSLYYPDKFYQVAVDVQYFKSITIKDFEKKAKLRTKKEILDQADLILRLDWACVDARVNHKKTPGNLNADVVVEWHYTLNWLINYLKEPWDEVTTDT